MNRRFSSVLPPSYAEVMSTSPPSYGDAVEQSLTQARPNTASGHDSNEAEFETYPPYTDEESLNESENEFYLDPMLEPGLNALQLLNGRTRQYPYASLNEGACGKSWLYAAITLGLTSLGIELSRAWCPSQNPVTRHAAKLLSSLALAGSLSGLTTWSLYGFFARCFRRHPTPGELASIERRERHEIREFRRQFDLTQDIVYTDTLNMLIELEDILEERYVRAFEREDTNGMELWLNAMRQADMEQQRERSRLRREAEQ